MTRDEFLEFTREHENVMLTVAILENEDETGAEVVVAGKCDVAKMVKALQSIAADLALMEPAEVSLN